MTHRVSRTPRPEPPQATRWLANLIHLIELPTIQAATGGMATFLSSLEKGSVMPKTYRIAVLSMWPGLAQIWSGQEILGLILATLFALAFNFALVSRWIWTDAFPQAWPDFFAALTVITWLASLTYTFWWLGFCHPERHREEIEVLFREAHEAYLQGRWTDAKRRIERILTLDETDVDALMQLATLYTRSGQPGLARQTFRQCLEVQGGSKWRWEIQQAVGRLDRQS